MNRTYPQILGAAALTAVLIVASLKANGSEQRPQEASNYTMALSTGQGLQLSNRKRTVDDSHMTQRRLYCARVIDVLVITVGLDCTDDHKTAAFRQRL